MAKHGFQLDTCFLSTTSMFNDPAGLPTSQYGDVLLRSAFTLCPGGTNEETYRVWEALEAGSIPVLKAGEAALWVEAQLGSGHPLPMVRDWTEVADTLRAALFSGDSVMEGHAAGQMTVLCRRVDELQAQVQVWWARYKAKQGRLFADMLRPPL